MRDGQHGYPYTVNITTDAPDETGKAVMHVEDPGSSLTTDAVTAAVTSLADLGATSIELWIHTVTDHADAAATALGFVAYRDLWQLQCPLPAEPSTLHTRAFTDDDIDNFVAVNNRAFSWHPEQSGLTSANVRETMAEPWFNHDGFRLYQPGDALLGFCWTKVHADHDPVLGEIYVIAIDPSAHGRGLGGPMTLAGLDWLAAQGIEHGMLYVESDNNPANATYRRLGFSHHHTDRAYALADLSAMTKP